MSLFAEPITFSIPLNVSDPSPDAVPPTKSTVTAETEFVKRAVSLPAPPVSVSFPAPPSRTSSAPAPSKTLSLPSPVISSAFAEPVTFSIVTRVSEPPSPSSAAVPAPRSTVTPAAALL